MSDYNHEFWTSEHRYEDLAREFEQNVERVYPPDVSSDKLCRWCYHCPWAASTVIYYEYRGPSVK